MHTGGAPGDLADRSGEGAPGGPCGQRPTTSVGSRHARGMAIAPLVPDSLRGAPFRGSAAVAGGLLTRAQLRSGCWRRLLRDVYCHVDVPDDPALRAAAAALTLPPGGVVGGAQAAWLHGADVVRSAAPMEVYALGVRTRPGLLVRAWTLDSDDICEVGGVPVTTPLRTAFDLVRRQSLVEGVVALDAMAHLGLVTGVRLAEYSDSHPRWRGVRRVARVVELHEPGSESPMESRLRMVLVIGGLPRPEVQIEVYDVGGLLVGRLDLGYRAACVGVEFDGRRHHTGESRRGDDRRDNSLSVYGFTVLRYDAADVYRRPGLILHQVALALGAAGVHIDDLDVAAVSGLFEAATPLRSMT